MDFIQAALKAVLRIPCHKCSFKSLQFLFYQIKLSHVFEIIAMANLKANERFAKVNETKKSETLQNILWPNYLMFSSAMCNTCSSIISSLY